MRKREREREKENKEKNLCSWKKGSKKAQENCCSLY